MNKLQVIVRPNPFAKDPNEKTTTLLLNDVPLQQVVGFRVDNDTDSPRLLTLQLVVDEVVMGE